MTSESVDVLVIGAGVVGTTIAYELGAGGASVMLLDAAADIGGGCSYANAGVLAPGHVGPLANRALVVEGARQMFGHPPAVRVHPQLSLVPWLTRLIGSARPGRTGPATARLQELAHRSVARHRQYVDAGLSPTYRHTGALEIYTDRHRRGGPDGISEDRARQLVPAIGRITAAHHDPDEAVLESRSYLRAMLAGARDLGVDARFNRAAIGLLTDGAAVRGVQLATGQVSASHVVLATGLGTTALAGSIGVRVPLRGGRGYVVDLRVSGRIPAMPVRLKERRIVVTPLPDRLRVCGLMEFGAERRPLDHRRADAMVRTATAALPGVRVESVLDTWCGERPCSADGMPVIGRCGAAPGLTVAAGHGMWGLILAPVTAELVAEDLLRPSGAAPDPLLTPDRFRRRRR